MAKRQGGVIITASFVIFNSSNWEGEDIEVVVGNGKIERLKPGEFRIYGAYPLEDAKYVKVVPRHADETRPFVNARDGQTLPEFDARWSNGEPVKPKDGAEESCDSCVL